VDGTDALRAQGASQRHKHLHSGSSYKRLEQGRLLGDWSAVRTRQTDWTGLKLLLEGIEPKRVRKRYRHPTTGENNLQHNA
jgi:hypothetical protein